jgi:3'(2'),5'-bisphosphate nucleotidase
MRDDDLVDFRGEDRDAIAIALAEIALLAGPPVMEEYNSGGDFRAKGDGSPVTAADERAEAVIAERLRALAPGIPIIAEEAVAGGARIEIGARFFLVDPLDGTREFVAKNGEFTVNVALIEGDAPIAGAVYAPAIHRIWFAGRTGHVVNVRTGERLPPSDSHQRLTVRTAPLKLTAIASRSHADPETELFLRRLRIAERIASGSSIKFCLISEGRADVYPRFAPTMEWDTAAGDAVLRAAGGCVLRPDGAPLLYGKLSESLRNSAFIAWGDRQLAGQQR